MLRLGVIDANEKANRAWVGLTNSVVGQWLRWEISRAGLEVHAPTNSDVLLLSFSGSVEFLAGARRYLRRFKIQPDAGRRGRVPYIVVGGPVDATPASAFGIADALAVGEGYSFVRELVELAKSHHSTVADVEALTIAHRHAIERSEWEALERDRDRPWLFSAPPPILAEPDERIDWQVPPVRSDDGVVRIVASKGCHMKCTFCATTYRQRYQRNEDSDAVLYLMRRLRKKGDRIQLLSNDPANLPYFRRVTTQMAQDSQSFTISEMMDRENRRAIQRARVRMARFGVEGLSERIRNAFGKAVPDQTLLEIIAEFASHRINTHIFMIVGAPYESEADWLSFRAVYRALAIEFEAIRRHRPDGRGNLVRDARGIFRAKFSTFVPNPPAPLARFVPSHAYDAWAGDLQDWIAGNCASRYMLCIWNHGAKTQARRVGEQIGVKPATALELLEQPADCYDLLPDESDAKRATWECIRWPLPPEKRWRMGNVYRRKMGAEPRAAIVTPAAEVGNGAQA